jgi:hypothetical protein
MIDDINDTDHVRLDSRLENIEFVKPDGSKTAPFNTVLSYLPDSGSGQPSAADLTPPSAQARATARPQGIGCGLGNSATVNANITYNGKTLTLPRTKITVWDENPWLLPSVVASGYTDNNGNFTFQKPACDWGWWGDYSQPDIYFTLETLDSSEIGVWNIFFPIYNTTYGIRTSTNWDVSPATSSFSINLTGGNSNSENAMWLYRMVQLAQDYNVTAGGAGAEYFKLRVAWPSRIDLGGTSFALVSKLEIRGPEWLSPYTAWHEFGHELMYHTTSPAGYWLAYFRGPFALTDIIPPFQWGSHGGSEQQNVSLAYNEGFANYVYAMVAEFNGFGTSSVPYFTQCNGTAGCSAYTNGDENERRVSTFLYRYSKEVLSPSTSSVNMLNSFNLIRSRLYGVNFMALSFSNAWQNWFQYTLPNDTTFKAKAKTIATDTFFTLSGL